MSEYLIIARNKNKRTIRVIDSALCCDCAQARLRRFDDAALFGETISVASADSTINLMDGWRVIDDGPATKKR